MISNHPFIIGKSYLRNDLMEFVGSKERQKGIIYGPKEEGVIIITSGGRHSRNSGYEDAENDDGTWSYYGQGKTGDQDPKRKSNAMLVSGERSILLFQTKEPNAREVRKQGSFKKSYVFRGEFVSDGYELIRPDKGPRKGLHTIRVKLIPVGDGIRDNQNPISETEFPESIEEMRSNILLKQSENKKDKTTRSYLTKAYERDAEIKRYTLLRAVGECEYCKKKAPFLKKNGAPYLEVHHILRLADFGDDKIENVIGLCPNCHREAHYGSERDRIRKAMLLTVQSKETKG